MLIVVRGIQSTQTHQIDHILALVYYRRLDGYVHRISAKASGTLQLMSRFTLELQ